MRGAPVDSRIISSTSVRVCLGSDLFELSWERRCSAALPHIWYALVRTVVIGGSVCVDISKSSNPVMDKSIGTRILLC